MTSNSDYNTPNKLLQQNINYWKILRILISRWYWIVGSVIIGYTVAWLIIKYTPPTYVTQSTLKLDNGDQSQLGLQSPNPTARYYKPNIIETEGLIIRSEEVILKAIKRLNYNISYFIEGRIRTTEVYPNVPFEVVILKQDSTNFRRDLYEVHPINTTSFSLNLNNEPHNVKTYLYGQPIELGNTVFTINSQIPDKGNYSFRFNTARDFYGRAVNGLSIEEAEKNTNIMRISHYDENSKFSSDLLNAIVKEYINNDAELKKRSAIQTINYLDDQIRYLDTTLQKSSDNLSDLQKTKSLVDPITDKELNSGQLSDFQKQINELQINDIAIKQIEEQIKSNNNQLKLNLDIESSGNSLLNNLIVEYNKNILLRSEKLIDFNINSDPVKQIDKTLRDYRSAIISNIKQQHIKNQQSINFLNKKISSVNTALKQIPETQNLFSKLQNKYDVNQKISSMLFERKLSAQITKAAIVPGATVISSAEPSFTPISPIVRKIYAQYMILGLLLGVGLIVLIRILNPFIFDVETIEGLTSTPIIGVILKYPEKINQDLRRILSLEKPKSVFAESVRSVRTNLSFMASQEKTKVICVTSEISGEGKSFVTVNLAGTLSIIDKKVIVIAADLRRSKLHKTFASDNKKGLSTYLSSRDKIEDIIFKDEVNNFDFITSGPVPPNPSELLHNSLMAELLDHLKTKYEYIIIDTAPVGLVSDSIPLIRKADINLFIIRSGKSKFRAATIPDRLSKEYGLSNIAIILNSFGDEKLFSNIYSTNYAQGNAGSYYYSDYTGYGNYGYYDNVSRKKWWKFWK